MPVGAKTAARTAGPRAAGVAFIECTRRQTRLREFECEPATTCPRADSNQADVNRWRFFSFNFSIRPARKASRRGSTTGELDSRLAACQPLLHVSLRRRCFSPPRVFISDGYASPCNSHRRTCPAFPITPSAVWKFTVTRTPSTTRTDNPAGSPIAPRFTNFRGFLPISGFGPVVLCSMVCLRCPTF